jgi:hypothetical protein
VTEFKSFNLFLNRMAKKKTTQGIGYINNTTEFDNLVTKVAIIITEEFNRTSDNATAINNVKRSIDNLVGSTRESFTKTDVYQVSYLMFYSILKDTAEAQNRTFKENPSKYFGSEIDDRRGIWQSQCGFADKLPMRS